MKTKLCIFATAVKAARSWVNLNISVRLSHCLVLLKNFINVKFKIGKTKVAVNMLFFWKKSCHHPLGSCSSTAARDHEKVFICGTQEHNSQLPFTGLLPHSIPLSSFSSHGPFLFLPSLPHPSLSCSSQLFDHTWLMPKDGRVGGGGWKEGHKWEERHREPKTEWVTCRGRENASSGLSVRHMATEWEIFGSSRSKLLPPGLDYSLERTSSGYSSSSSSSSPSLLYFSFPCVFLEACCWGIPIFPLKFSPLVLFSPPLSPASPSGCRVRRLSSTKRGCRPWR